MGANRADIVAERQHQAQAISSLKMEKAKIDAQRGRVEADVGPLRYLAELTGAPATDLERPARLLTLALVAVLDPMAWSLSLPPAFTRRVRAQADHLPGWPESETMLAARMSEEPRHLAGSEAPQGVSATRPARNLHRTPRGWRADSDEAARL
jgi:hypothetical protein